MSTYRINISLVLVLGACGGGSEGGGPRPEECNRDYPCQGSVCPEPLLSDTEGVMHRVEPFGGSFFIAEDLKISEVSATGERVLIGEFPAGPLSHLAVDETGIYAATAGTIRVMDRSTGVVSVVGDVAAVEVWTVGENVAFVREDKSAWLLPKSGGSPTEIAPVGTLGWWRLAVVGDSVLYSNVDGDVLEWNTGSSTVVIPHAEGVPDPPSGPDPEPWRAEDLVANATQIRFRDQVSRLYVANRDGTGLRRMDTVVEADALWVSGDQFAVGSALEIFVWGDGEPVIFYRPSSIELRMGELAFGEQTLAWFAGCTLTRADVP